MKVFAVLSVCLMVCLVPTVVFADWDSNEYDDFVEPIMARARLIELVNEEQCEYGLTHQVFTAEILEGVFKGEQVAVTNTLSGNTAMDMILHCGDKVILALEVVDDNIQFAYPQDFYRESYVYVLIGMFIVSLLVFGRLKGLKTVITLAITISLIAGFMLPAMLRGYDPLLVAVVTSIIITVVTLLIIGGLTRKTLAAVIGTTGGVLIAACVSLWVGYAAKLTGLSGHEAQMLIHVTDGVEFSFTGLLLAGIIIGALGAVMDVSMSIASAMEEVRVNNPGISRSRLIGSGMNVGKDIMGTMSNTLILAYTGTSIPLLLLLMAYRQSYLKILNMEFIAAEFLRALSGSIGLIFAIPVTAVVSAAVMRIVRTERGEAAS